MTILHIEAAGQAPVQARLQRGRVDPGSPWFALVHLGSARVIGKGDWTTRQAYGKVTFVTQTKVLRLARVRAVVVSGEARRLRQAARLSISEIASECGVDQSTVWRWENGTRLPRGESALRYGELIDSLREQAQKSA